MSGYNLALSEDEALVLIDFFDHLNDVEKIEFAHRAEFLALRNLGEQLIKNRAIICSEDYAGLLVEARGRLDTHHRPDPNQSAFEGF